MDVRDLGTLDGPILIYGGPYSNAAATEAVLREADLRCIPDTHRICTGDVVAYGGTPKETVALIRARGGAVVAGNCERQLGIGADICGCGFAPGSTCDRLSAAWFAFADRETDDATRAWMRALPDIVTFRHAGMRCAVLHGGATDIARFLWANSPDDAFREEIAALHSAIGPVNMILAGHSGLPFERVIDNVRWVNAGAIGLPPNDGRPETRFATLEDGAVRFHDLTYDVARAGAEMEAAGLTQGYHDTLRSGWWPSENVLPPEFRRAAVELSVSGERVML